jgi:glyoxylase-like metal-dependent hydrolase (beta-lactamase superfamily II)
MNIKKTVSGAFQTNTYIISDGKNSVIIDPASQIKENESYEAILLTHGHFDHTSSAAFAAKAGGKIHIHEDDAEMLNDIEKSFGTLFPRLFIPCNADVLLKDGDVIEFGKLKFNVMHTPGHSKGGVMYIIGDVIFTGDTLFAGSVGRIDGYGGSHREQMESLEKIKKIDGDYRILPGHGEESTLEYEKRTNSFLL